MFLNIRSRARRRGGFSLAEILVAVAIMAIVSAMVVPALYSKLRSSQTAALSQTYLGLSQGIAEFKRATTRYPLLLSSLTALPVATDDDICGNDITALNVALWRGPYASRTITAAGVLINDVTIRTTLRRVAGPPIFLMIDAPAVEDAVVNELEAQLDAGAADGTTGTIRFSTGVVGAMPASPAGTSNLSYAIPINSC
jgi:prepilin-type N-terminal cleavage/methylation domain-containing protein